MESEIEVIKAKFNLKVEVFEKFGNSVSSLAYMAGNEKVIHFNMEKVEFKDIPSFIKSILEKYPSTETRQNVYEKLWSESPFRLYFSNNCKNQSKVCLSYNSNDYCINFNLSVDFYKNYLRVSSREVTESEYHYFPGTASHEIKKMRPRIAYVDRFLSKHFYGGNINCYPKVGDEEIFNEFVVNGDYQV